MKFTRLRLAVFSGVQLMPAAVLAQCANPIDVPTRNFTAPTTAN